VRRLTALRQEIHDEVCHEGWNEYRLADTPDLSLDPAQPLQQRLFLLGRAVQVQTPVAKLVSHFVVIPPPCSCSKR